MESAFRRASCGQPSHFRRARYEYHWHLYCSPSKAGCLTDGRSAPDPHRSLPSGFPQRFWKIRRVRWPVSPPLWRQSLSNSARSRGGSASVPPESAGFSYWSPDGCPPAHINPEDPLSPRLNSFLPWKLP